MPSRYSAVGFEGCAHSVAMAGLRESGAILLLPLLYHGVLATKDYAPIALGPVGRLRPLTAVLHRGDDGSRQFHPSNGRSP